MILSHGGRSRSCTDMVTELRATQSHQKNCITSQGVFIRISTSVIMGTIDLSSEYNGPTLSIFIRTFYRK